MTKFSFSFTFSIMALLVFSYFAFMGLIYWLGGGILLPAAITLAFVLVAIVCIYVMCLSKATRWTTFGLVGQIFFGSIVFVLLVAAACPFTNFIRAVEKSDEISQGVAAICDNAIGLDKAYAEYVDKRINDYKSNLQHVSNGKSMNPSRYQECLGRATGATDAEKINNLANSLRSKLLPASTDTIVGGRRLWLENAKGASVWNPLTPANINKIDSQVSGYLDNYKKLSETTYAGEEAVPFEYQEFNKSVSDFLDGFRHLQIPSVLALFFSLLCFLIMMLPYFLSERDIAAKESTSDDLTFNKNNR